MLLRLDVSKPEGCVKMTCNGRGKHAHGAKNGSGSNNGDVGHAGMTWHARPLYVAMEGIDNSGKTTLVGNIVPSLKNAGLNVDTIKYPRHRSSESVEAVNDRGTIVSQRELNIDMARERTDDAPAVLQMDCDIVIFDRYAGSGLAYGMANGFEEKWLKSLDAYSIVPDITILLDDPSTRHPNRSEYMGRVAATYMRLAKRHKWSIVPAKNGRHRRQGHRHDIVQVHQACDWLYGRRQTDICPAKPNFIQSRCRQAHCPHTRE